MPPFAGCEMRLATRQTCEGLSRRCHAAAIGSSLWSAGSRSPGNRDAGLPRPRIYVIPTTETYGGPATGPHLGSDANRRVGRCSRFVLWTWGSFYIFGAAIASSDSTASHAGGAPVPEHDGRSRSAVHQRRMTEELTPQLGRWIPHAWG